MTPALISQAAWAKRLGVSVDTFRRWRAEGRIPAPLELSGWPRWSEQTVARVTLDLQRSGEGRYFRTAQARRGNRRLQPSASRFQHNQRAAKPSVLTLQDVGDVHAVQDAPIVGADHLNSVEGAR